MAKLDEYNNDARHVEIINRDAIIVEAGRAAII
jgi:hypothetical protein